MHGEQIPYSLSRFDPISGDWVLYAPVRHQRPTDYHQVDLGTDAKDNCPFCAGHESRTPPTVWIGKRKGSNELHTANVPLTSNVVDHDWLVRVFANRYPCIPTSDPYAHGQRQTNIKSDLKTFGGHEVFVDTRNHTNRMRETSVDETRLLFRAFRDRLFHWYHSPGIEYVSVFKNSGAAAGASLIHSHSQLIATNYVPSFIQQNLARMRLANDSNSLCVLCNLNREELSDGSRMVLNGDSLIAYCPYASQFPMQVRITPREHFSYFEKSTDETLDECAMLTRTLIIALQQIIPEAAYNLVISSLPLNQHQFEPSFHWTIDICPRITGHAGFEIATRNAINPMLPEDSAAIYRRNLDVETDDS